MRTLLERNTAGLSVIVSWESLTEELRLVCQRNGEIAVAVLPPDKAMDAFAHPACYLAEDQLPLIAAR